MPCGKVTLFLHTPSGQEALQSLVLQDHSWPRDLNWACICPILKLNNKVLSIFILEHRLTCGSK